MHNFNIQRVIIFSEDCSGSFRGRDEINYGFKKLMTPRIEAKINEIMSVRRRAALKTVHFAKREPLKTVRRAKKSQQNHLDIFDRCNAR
jgi:hypothetical protein